MSLRRITFTTLLSAMALIFTASQTRAAELPPPHAFLEKHCFDCHDAETKKGGLDLVALAADSAAAGKFDAWVKVHDRLRDGEMPPKKKPQPDAASKAAVLQWLDAGLHAADAARQAREGRTVFRRLTRVEYEFTLRDLFSLPHLDVKDTLPPDAEEHGFDNIGAALTMSFVQMSRYLDAADAALDEALALGPRAACDVPADEARAEVAEVTVHLRQGEQLELSRVARRAAAIFRRAAGGEMDARVGPHRAARADGSHQERQAREAAQERERTALHGRFARAAARCGGAAARLHGARVSATGSRRRSGARPRARARETRRQVLLSGSAAHGSEGSAVLAGLSVFPGEWHRRPARTHGWRNIAHPHSRDGCATSRRLRTRLAALVFPVEFAAG